MPIGYILGTRDSVEFEQPCEAEWFPPLRKRYPIAPDDTHYTATDQLAIRWIHQGHKADAELAAYPAHLHILPAGQGNGWGRRLMHTFWQKLRALGIPAVHLGVSKSNPRAVGFYRHLGYQQIADYDTALLFGYHL